MKDFDGTKMHGSTIKKNTKCFRVVILHYLANCTDRNVENPYSKYEASFKKVTNGINE